MYTGLIPVIRELPALRGELTGICVMCVASTASWVRIRSCSMRGKCRLPVLAMTLPMWGNRCEFIISSMSFNEGGVQGSDLHDCRLVC